MLGRLHYINIVHQREIRVLNGKSLLRDVFLTDLKLKARICNFKDGLYIKAIKGKAIFIQIISCSKPTMDSLFKSKAKVGRD